MRRGPGIWVEELQNYVPEDHYARMCEERDATRRGRIADAVSRALRSDSDAPDPKEQQSEAARINRLLKQGSCKHYCGTNLKCTMCGLNLYR